jgi:hypothetical protein
MAGIFFNKLDEKSPLFPLQDFRAVTYKVHKDFLVDKNITLCQTLVDKDGCPPDSKKRAKTALEYKEPIALFSDEFAEFF